MLGYLILVFGSYCIYLLVNHLRESSLAGKRSSLLKKLENEEVDPSEIIDKLNLSLLIESRKTETAIDIDEAFKKIDITRGKYRVGKVSIDDLYQLDDKEILLIGKMVDRDFDLLALPAIDIATLDQAYLTLDRDRVYSVIFRLTFDDQQRVYRLYTSSDIKLDANMNNNLNEFGRYLFSYLLHKAG